MTAADSPRQKMEAFARRLIAPFLEVARSGEPLATAMPCETAALPRPDRAVHNPVEAIVRLLAGLSPWLELRYRRSGGRDQTLDALLSLLVKTLAQAMDTFETPARGGQALVEAAFLAQAMLRAPHALWAALDEHERATLLRALRGSRAIQPNQSNWRLFPAMVEAALIEFDPPANSGRIEEALHQIEAWYLGDGVYGDGPLLAIDYYGGYVIHPMMLEAAAVLARHTPAAQAMRQRIGHRFDRFCETLERQIGADGSFPPVGRSLAYRSAAFQPLALCALRPQPHPTLEAGQIRAALSAVIERSLGAPGTFDAKGWLRIGLNGAQPGLAEPYISTGSLYLCTQAFLPLGLGPGHPFWKVADRPWTQRRLWGMGHDLPPDTALEKR